MRLIVKQHGATVIDADNTTDVRERMNARALQQPERPPRLATALDAISDERIDEVYARAQAEHRGQP